jgi:hypothetical protein
MLTAGKRSSQSGSSRLTLPSLDKSPRPFLTTQVSSTQPLSETFVAKPEIRYATIVDVTFGENVTVMHPVNLYECMIGDPASLDPSLTYKEA